MHDGDVDAVGTGSSARFYVSTATGTLRIEPTIDAIYRAFNPLKLTIRPQPHATMCGAAARSMRR